MQGLLIVDHGSRRAAANEALHRMRELVQGCVGEEVVVCCAHMELASPTIEEGLRACVVAGATEVVVHPFMLSAGRHVTEDMPRLVGAAAAQVGVPARLTEPLGVHPLLAEVVLERCGLASKRAESGSSEAPTATSPQKPYPPAQ